MSDALSLVNWTIFKEIVGLKDSELKIESIWILENRIFIKENKQLLAAMNHKGFQGIVASLGKNIVQCIVGL